jgi:hypothetical protein
LSRFTTAFAFTVLLAVGAASCAGTPPSQVPGQSGAPDRVSAGESAFAQELARRTFDYFWETTDPGNCLAPDRWPSAPFSSIAATGFALAAYAIGAERGYVPREEAAARTRRCLEVYLAAPQGPEAERVSGYRGFFYHFLKLSDGTRHQTTELSSVDTSLLFAGVLFAQSYYDRDEPVERAIREAADALYRRADWTFFLRGPDDPPAANLPASKGLAMGWKPERGFESHDWVGYNEGMLIYVLALGSPTHPVSRAAWDAGWAARLEQDWGEYYGYEHLAFEPLFGHQYSHIWIDFRGIRDTFMRGKGIDYFENSRRATLAQYAYSQDNPAGWAGYGGDIWGLTACDGPGHATGYSVGGEPREFWGYSARGASPIRVRDDGTVAPTAAGGSIPFAPEIALPALQAMKDRYGTHLYTEYGFKDAFNPSFTFTDFDSKSGQVVAGVGWFARDHLGIDQGPILAMLENHRSELIWRTMRKNPYIRAGLEAIGFSGGWLEE